MEIFPLTPDRMEQSGVEFKTTIVDFETGYTQRTADWRKGKRRFTLSWNLMKNTDMDILLAFFEARKGRYEAFTLNNHRDGQSYTVNFYEDAIQFTHKNAYFSDVRVEVIENA